MNEQLQQALASILNKTMEGVEAGAAFLQSELPDVVHQLLIWKLAENAVMALLCAAVFYLPWKFVRVYRKSEDGSFLKDYSGSPEPQTVLIVGMIGIACFIAGSVGLESVFIALQIWLAPKIYLIEYAASLAK